MAFSNEFNNQEYHYRLIDYFIQNIENFAKNASKENIKSIDLFYCFLEFKLNKRLRKYFRSDGECEIEV
jgi:hypothetical protein